MDYTGNLLGGKACRRKFRIGATVIKGQVICADISAGPGDVTVPGTVNAWADTIGVTNEAVTYSTASPPDFVEAICALPGSLFVGKACGGVASDTAFTAEQLLTATAASTAASGEFTDAGVGTSDYIGGLLIALSGANKGHVRVCTVQHDNTHTGTTVLFPSAFAVGDTMLRTIGLNYGAELTTTYEQFNNMIAAGEAVGDATSTGSCVIWDVLVDQSSCAQADWIPIQNPTAPDVRFVFSCTNTIFEPID